MRYHFRHFLQFERTRKRDDAGKGDVEADIERAARHVAIAGEAVEDAADLLRRLLSEYSEGVVIGLARMNDDRQMSLPGETNLLAKDLLLDIARRKVVVIVEPDFA